MRCSARTVKWGSACIQSEKPRKTFFRVPTKLSCALVPAKLSFAKHRDHIESPACMGSFTWRRGKTQQAPASTLLFSGATPTQGRAGSVNAFVSRDVPTRKKSTQRLTAETSVFDPEGGVKPPAYVSIWDAINASPSALRAAAYSKATGAGAGSAVMTNRNNLKLRKAAELESEVVGELKAGTRVHILQQKTLPVSRLSASGASHSGVSRSCLALEGQTEMLGWVRLPA